MYIEQNKFSLEMVRFYAAELVLALEHLISFSVVHRDLKLDNILIDENFHVKIVRKQCSHLKLLHRLILGKAKNIPYNKRYQSNNLCRFTDHLK